MSSDEDSQPDGNTTQEIAGESVETVDESTPSEAEKIEQIENGTETVDDDFDDDDFGDFEEAVAAPSASIPEPVDPFPETPTKSASFGFANFGDKNLVPVATPEFNATFELPPPQPVPSLPSLSDILSSESDLWDFGTDNADSLVVDEPLMYDYFLPFDTGKVDSEGMELPDHFVQALEVWSQICFVEDTPALKLKYDKTALYEGMLSALSMSSAKAASKDKPVVIPVMNPIPASSTFDLELKPAPLPPSGGIFSNTPPAVSIHVNSTRGAPFSSDEIVPLEASNATTSSINFTTTLTASASTDNNPILIDSLSVPPVNFDWGSAGLSNPLTGAAISDFAAILDCDFASKTSTDYSLEAELEKFGLGRSQKELPFFPDTQELTFGNNSLNLDDILREHHNNTSGPTNGVVELSADGKTLLEALPDYSFMLSKMLMFPVNR